jgi:enoyl-CoA hydratase/carnithine racemase
VQYEDIELIKDEGIAFIHLNRPKVLNALSETMMHELFQALKETEEDPDIRVLILTGRGSGFCAGADLDKFFRPQGKGDDPKKRATFGLLDLPRAFVQYPKPIIAAINGPSYGFGFTVALTCDIRLASERATFSIAFVRIGLTPEFYSTRFLPDLIGYGKAAELIFTARPFDAREALEIGAVNRVFPHDRLIPETRKMAQQIASMPPAAVRSSKEILRQGMQSTLDQAVQYEARAFLDCMDTEEHRLALDGLLAKLKSRDAKGHRSKK